MTKDFNWKSAGAIIFAIGCASVFLVRGVWRGMTRANDFFVNYLGARAWLAGLNPYGHTDPWSMRPPDFPLASLHAGSAYPPAVFPLSSPIAIWDSASAVALFVTITAVIYVIACVFFLWRVCRIQSRPLRFASLGFCLLSYPVETGLSLGQYSTLSFAVMLLAFSVYSIGGRTQSAVLLAASLALKPQIGVALLAYFALLKNWRVVTVTIALYVLITAIAVAWTSFSLGTLGWIGDIFLDIRNVDAQQVQIYCCVNLQMITREIIPGGEWQRLADILAFVMLIFIWELRHNRVTGNKVLEVSALSLIFLLPIYHRPYDLVFIVLVIGWAAEVFPTEPRPIFLAALMAIFVLPVPTLGLAATLFPEAGPGAESLPIGIRLFVVPHTTWLLLALIWFLLARMTATNSTGKDVASQLRASS